MEAIAIRLEAIAPRNKKLLVAPGITTWKEGLGSSQRTSGTCSKALVVDTLLGLTFSVFLQGMHRDPGLGKIASLKGGSTSFVFGALSTRLRSLPKSRCNVQFLQ